VTVVLLALFFVPALVTIAVLLVRWRRVEPVRVLAEAVPPPPTVSGELDPLASLDLLLAELEGATVRIDGADELDETAVVQLEQLAGRLEAAAATLEGVR
jgi:hypothetical protein